MITLRSQCSHSGKMEIKFHPQIACVDRDLPLPPFSMLMSFATECVGGGNKVPFLYCPRKTNFNIEEGGRGAKRKKRIWKYGGGTLFPFYRYSHHGVLGVL